MESRQIEVRSAGRILTLEARIADSNNERAAGYQWICGDDAKDSAVLFIFPAMIESAFHMRNVIVPLDIHFFDAEGVQVDSMVMRPEPAGVEVEHRYYRPASGFQYALEIARPANHDLQSTPALLQLLIHSL